MWLIMHPIDVLIIRKINGRWEIYASELLAWGVGKIAKGTADIYCVAQVHTPLCDVHSKTVHEHLEI